MLVVVRVGVGQSRHFHELRAAEPQHVLLFLTLRLRDHDDGAVAARVGDDGDTDAGVPGGAFDDQAAGLQFAAFLGFKDHLAAGAVLHRTAGIHELGLAEDRAPGFGRSARQLDQRSVTDGLHDSVAGLHIVAHL